MVTLRSFTKYTWNGMDAVEGFINSDDKYLLSTYETRQNMRHETNLCSSMKWNICLQIYSLLVAFINLLIDKYGCICVQFCISIENTVASAKSHNLLQQ